MPSLNPAASMASPERHSALAIDCGSSSVRAILGLARPDLPGQSCMGSATVRAGLGEGVSTRLIRLGGWEVETLEILRAPHKPERDSSNHLVWDFPAIAGAVTEALERAQELLGRPVQSVGIDTWGVDYGLLDHDGRLIAPPRCYRDERTARTVEEFESLWPSQEAWRHSGIQSAPINTINQLHADVKENPGLAGEVSTMLMLPDLLNHLLGAPICAGRAIASSSGLTTPGAHSWNHEATTRLGIPDSWLPPLVDDLSIAGHTSAGTAITRPGGHDTACAVHSLGLDANQAHLFISCGSWSLVGATCTEPLLGEEVRDAGLTNEVRSDGGIRLLRNLTGLWILQELQREWGVSDPAVLVSLARVAPSAGYVVDPDDPSFQTPGGMEAALTRWCSEHYAQAPRGRGQIIRLVLESLACAHARYINRIAAILGSLLPSGEPIYMMGGGVRNDVLLEMTAHACERSVIVGSAEASADGNLAAQLEVCAGAVGGTNPRQRHHRRRIVPVGDSRPFIEMNRRLASCLGMSEAC